MLDTKLSLVVVLRWDVVGVEFVLEVELVEHGGVGALQEAEGMMFLLSCLWLLVNWLRLTYHLFSKTKQ